MARRSKTQERIFTVFFMFAVTFVSISAVALLFVATQEAVKRNEKLFLQRAVMEAAGAMPEGGVGVQEILAWYQSHVRPIRDGKGEVVRFDVVDPGTQQPAVHVFIRSGNGLWGKIKAVVGVDRTLAVLTGVTFVEQNETPGLGARIDEPWFKAQFRGKTGPFERRMPEGTRSGAAGEMDAITGATVTSKAVQDILNGTLRDAPALVGGETRQTAAVR